MSDISKINPDGTEYNLKDATARTNIGNLASLHTTEKNDAVSAINEVKDEQANKADNDEVAPEFNATTAYSAGELVYKDGQLYKFDSDHAAGAWDSSEVSPTTVAAEFNQLKNTLTSAEEALDEVKNDSWVVLNDNVKYRVSGGFVYISARVSYTNDKWVIIGTMPEGLRPSNSVYNCCLYTMTPGASYANLYCNSQGSIQQFANATVNNGFLLYPIEQ